MVVICISLMLALIFNNLFKLRISSGRASRWGNVFSEPPQLFLRKGARGGGNTVSPRVLTVHTATVKCFVELPKLDQSSQVRPSRGEPLPTASTAREGR